MSLFYGLVKYFLPILFITYNVWYYLSDSYLAWFTKLSVIGSLAIVSWTLAYYLFEKTHTETVSPNEKVVLVTGCDSGFGHDLAARLDRFGFHVFAGVLFPDGDGALRLQNRCSKRLQIVRMDVTSAEEVESVVEQIKATKMPLWAVVNNAGIGFGAFFDWGKDIEAYKKLLDVNLFGVIRVTKNCVPLLRESKGRIVNVASVAGRIPCATLAHYCIAKHGVRVFSDCIRREFSLNGDDITVVTIEPTFYKTEIINESVSIAASKRIFDESPEDIKKAYGNKDNFFKIAFDLIGKIARPAIYEVTEAMENGVVLQSPKLFYRCGGYHDIVIWIVSHMPEVVLDHYMNNKFGEMMLSIFVWFFKSG